MFTLHESTRRGLCRMGFFFLCVLPICAIVAAHFWVHSDLRRRACEAELGQFLGSKVSIERVIATQPRGVRYQGLRLVDPETNAEIGRAAALDVVWHDKQTLVQFTVPELISQQIDCLHDMVLRQLRMGQAGECVQIYSPKLTVKLPGARSTSFEDIRGVFAVVQGDAQFTTSFAVVDRENASQSQTPVEVEVIRNRQTTPPSTQFEIHTNGNRVPSCVGDSLFPALARLGPLAEFQGDAVFVNSNGWNGKVKGTFVKTNLAHLTVEQAIPRLTGVALIGIDIAELVDGRIEYVKGHIESGGGSIQNGLIGQIANGLQLRMNGDPAGTQRYSHLNLGFAIGKSGIYLQGLSAAGAALVNEGGRPIITLAEPRPVAVAAVEAAFSQSRGALLAVLPLTNEILRR